MIAKRRDKRWSQTITTLGDKLSISLGNTSKRETGSEDGHGYFDPKTGEIVIGDHVPEPLRHVVLMHEVLHVVDTMLKGNVTKRYIPHDWIINGAPLLVAILTEAGFWKDGPTLRELDRAMRASNERKAPPKRVRRS